MRQREMHFGVVRIESFGKLQLAYALFGFTSLHQYPPQKQMRSGLARRNLHGLLRVRKTGSIVVPVYVFRGKRQQSKNIFGRYLQLLLELRDCLIRPVSDEKDSIEIVQLRKSRVLGKQCLE